jgi:LysR family glycine cleavage system transcriptional activator
VIADFTNHRLIQDNHNHWAALLGAAGLAVPVRMMQFNQTALAMDAAANGQGIALVPRLLAQADFTLEKLSVLWRNIQADRTGFYIISEPMPKPKPARHSVINWILSEVTSDKLWKIRKRKSVCRHQHANNFPTTPRLPTPSPNLRR